MGIDAAFEIKHVEGGLSGRCRVATFSTHFSGFRLLLVFLFLILMPLLVLMRIEQRGGHLFLHLFILFPETRDAQLTALGFLALRQVGDKCDDNRDRHDHRDDFG